jgi:hypothetical protein
MADFNIDTQSAGYQTRLVQLREIMTFYKPLLKKYLSLRNPEAQAAWRERDPMLNIILTISERVSTFSGEIDGQ